MDALLAKKTCFWYKSTVNSRGALFFLAVCALIFFVCPARAQNADGFWDTAGGGSWANAGNWDSGIIADGADNTAYFGITLFADIPASATFTLNGARTIGHLFFTDQNGPDNWILTTGSGGPLTLAATFDFPSITVNLADQQLTISAVLAGINGLEKLGDGTLILTATNTYTDPTTVGGGALRVNGRLGPDAVTVMRGTLGGTGTITGPVTVQAGGVLSPGNSVGALTISNSLTLQSGSTTFIEVNASTLARDTVKGLSAANYGGTLVVSNLAGTPALGQSFAIFSAAGASGNFNALAPQLTGGLRWRFDPAGGVLSVVSTNSQPKFASITLLDKTNLLMLVTNGTPGVINYVLASTNPALPRTNWTRLSTNVFDVSGNLAFTNAMNLNTAQKFFQISVSAGP